MIMAKDLLNWTLPTIQQRLHSSFIQRGRNLCRGATIVSHLSILGSYDPLAKQHDRGTFTFLIKLRDRHAVVGPGGMDDIR